MGGWRTPPCLTSIWCRCVGCQQRVAVQNIIIKPEISLELWKKADTLTSFNPSASSALARWVCIFYIVDLQLVYFTKKFLKNHKNTSNESKSCKKKVLLHIKTTSVCLPSLVQDLNTCGSVCAERANAFLLRPLIGEWIIWLSNKYAVE